jgi:hypothetical protein
MSSTTGGLDRHPHCGLSQRMPCHARFASSERVISRDARHFNCLRSVRIRKACQLPSVGVSRKPDRRRQPPLPQLQAPHPRRSPRPRRLRALTTRALPESRPPSHAPVKSSDSNPPDRDEPCTSALCLRLQPPPCSRPGTRFGPRLRKASSSRPHVLRTMSTASVAPAVRVPETRHGHLAPSKPQGNNDRLPRSCEIPCL